MLTSAVPDRTVLTCHWKQLKDTLFWSVEPSLGNSCRVLCAWDGTGRAPVRAANSGKFSLLNGKDSRRGIALVGRQNSCCLPSQGRWYLVGMIPKQQGNISMKRLFGLFVKKYWTDWKRSYRHFPMHCKAKSLWIWDFIMSISCFMEWCPIIGFEEHLCCGCGLLSDLPTGS